LLGDEKPSCCSRVGIIGATSVGKTSLMARFVSSIFREHYETTIGVRIDTRRVRVGDGDVTLILWDMSGEDEFQNVQPAYLRGAAGYLLVIDGTRRETVGTAISLHEMARRVIGDAPFVAVLNKADLDFHWEIDARMAAEMEQRGWQLIRTSAKTGDGVEEAFARLVAAIRHRRGPQWTLAL
jgi:small GTP-binding protein